MASDCGQCNEQSETEWHGFTSGNWTDILHEDVNYASRTELDCDSDECKACYVGLVDHTLNPDFSHRTQPSAAVVKPMGDNIYTDDDDDDDVDIHHWCEAGRTLRSFLSRSSDTCLLFGNDDELVTNTDIATGREPTSQSVPTTNYYPAHGTCSSNDICSKDCESLPERSHNVSGSSLPANSLLLLEDVPQASFLPLFSDLRQKISGLDSDHKEELCPREWQRRERSVGHSKTSQPSTWSEYSSSDESENRWFHSRRGQRCDVRRPMSDVRCRDWWARTCSEEPDCCMIDGSKVSRRRCSSRKQKKFTTKKSVNSSSLVNDKFLNDVLLPLEASLTKEQSTWHHDGTLFTECLADIESNATDSDNVGRVTDDEDCDNYLISGNGSSPVMAPVACSFHCIPPDNSCSIPPISSNDRNCLSSEDELSASLGNVHISDHGSCLSSCSFGGRENNIDSNVVDSDWDTELTSAAVSTAAAAAADDDAGDGWQMCDVQTRLLPPEWYSYRNGEVSSLDDCDDDDDLRGADDLHLVDSDADDEFECDCPVCLMYQQHISESWQQDRERLLTTGTAENTQTNNYVPAGYYDDDGDDADLVSFTFTGSDFQSAFSEGVTINTIFQDVVVQMLQQYPNLLTTSAPPPLTDDEFYQLPSMTVSLAALGDDSSCPICLSLFEESEDAKILPCHHMFHTLCIHAWLNKAGTCPVCRQYVITDSVAAAGISRHNDDDSDASFYFA